MAKASRNAKLADAYAELFNAPERGWELQRSPEATADFIRQLEPETLRGGRAA